MPESSLNNLEIRRNIFYFHPCYCPRSEVFEPQKLLKIIGVSHCIYPSIFADLAGAFLSNADFSNADLCNTNFSDANFSNANLTGVNFRGADLFCADLRSANLGNASLREACLIGADLTGADLRTADLCSADLSGANLRTAVLSNIDGCVQYNQHTIGERVIGLDQAIGVPSELKRQIGLNRL